MNSPLLIDLYYIIAKTTPLLKMERYTLQRTEIVKIYCKNDGTFAITARKTKAVFGHREAPSHPKIVKLLRKFVCVTPELRILLEVL